MRKSTGLALTLAALWLPVCDAQAAKWVPLTKVGTADKYSYDSSKLTIKGNAITYWKKVVFETPQPIQGGVAKSGLLRERIDCAEHTAKLISYLYYSTSGETLEYVANSDTDAAPIIPDTVGDAFERALCPKVWRKQETDRIKAEQQAAEAELSALKQKKEASPVPTPAKAPEAGSQPSPAAAAPPSSGTDPGPAPEAKDAPE